MRAVAGGLVVMAVAGCDLIFGIKPVARDAAVDTSVDAVVLPRSCKDIHTASATEPSGMYTIDPDGDGGAAPLTVVCDMTTNGGGWTLVFAPPSANVTMAIPYTATVPALLVAASDALVAYRDAGLHTLTGAAMFALPQDWRTASPFTSTATDTVIMVSIDGAAPVSGTLRYGSSDFDTSCDGAWNAAGLFGRVCIDGTTAPFYSAFADAGGDFCDDSASAAGGTACTADRQLTISVR